MNNGMNYSSMPLVSCLIPAYNHEKYVQECLLSFIDQTYPNIELLIIDDASSDATREKIREMLPACEKRFARVTYRENTENGGISKSLNAMIKESRGEYIKLLASDDRLSRPDAIAFLIDEMERDVSLDVVCGDVEFIDDNGEICGQSTGGYSVSFPQVQVDNNCATSYLDLARLLFANFSGFEEFAIRIPEPEELYAALLVVNIIPAQGVLLRKNLFTKCGGFDESLMVEDWDMWLRIALNHRIRIIKEPVALYRLHSTNMRNRWRRRMNCDFLHTLRRQIAVCEERKLLKAWKRGFYSFLCGSMNSIGITPTMEVLANIPEGTVITPEIKADVLRRLVNPVGYFAALDGQAAIVPNSAKKMLALHPEEDEDWAVMLYCLCATGLYSSW